MVVREVVSKGQGEGKGEIEEEGLLEVWEVLGGKGNKEGVSKVERERERRELVVGGGLGVMCDIERYIKWGGAKCIRGFGERDRGGLG